MPRAKISEFSTTAGDNTDIDGINIGEGCAPSGINDAIRELMAQLKDFQSGAAGDNITVVGTLAAKGTSSSGADLKLYEDTDNGTNYVGFIAPASIASNVQWTLPSADGSSGQALQTNGSGTLSFATLGISAGGTGQTTANAAFNALAPSQTGNSGRYLTTDGTNTSWAVNPLGTVTSVAMSVPSFLSVSGSPITSSGTLAVSLSGTALPTANGGTGLTSFTANGVVYASSTSALTTGSALVFDGTNLGIGTSSPTDILTLAGGASGSYGLTINNAKEGGGTKAIFQFDRNNQIAVLGGNTTNGLAFQTLTSGSLTTKATIDSSGNLGLGVTPSAWSSSMRVLQVASTALYNNGFNDTFLGANFYNDTGGTNRYINSDFAAAYGQSGGTHAWFTAPSGTAGDTISFTQAATLTADGDFLVGTTTAFARLSVIVPGGANRNLIQAGVTAATDGLTVKWNHATSTIRMNIQNLPTSSSGLASGDLWNDGGTLKVA